jgi:hypothetical protein
MKKRGQVAVFVILAVMLVVAGGIAFIITKKGSDSGIDKNFFSQPYIKQSMDQIQSSIIECETTVASDSLDFIGMQGGYYKKPKEYFNLNESFLPYYYNQGEILMPSNLEIQNQLALYVNNNLNSCLENIKISDFDLTYTKPDTKTIINKGYVTFNIDMPISVRKADSTTLLELKDNPVSLNSDLYSMIEIAGYITDSHKKDPNALCINCIANMAKERNLYVSMEGFEDNSTIIISIFRDQTNVFPSVFKFLNKYSEV